MILSTVHDTVVGQCLMLSSSVMALREINVWLNAGLIKCHCEVHMHPLELTNDMMRLSCGRVAVQ